MATLTVAARPFSLKSTTHDATASLQYASRHAPPHVAAGDPNCVSLSASEVRTLLRLVLTDMPEAELAARIGIVPFQLRTIAHQNGEIAPEVLRFFLVPVVPSSLRRG